MSARDVGRNFALAGLVAASALAGGEAALRIGGYHAPIFHVADPLLGYRLRPGAEGPFREEGASEVVISSAGLRDREHTVSKPAGTLRIAVLGDSYSEAMHVPLDSTYWARLPGLIGRCGIAGGRSIEIINFGVSGYGTAQELLTLPRALRYAPDLILAQVTVHNDIRNNSAALNPAKTRPFFLPAEDGGIRFDGTYVRRAFERQRTLPWRAFRASADLRTAQLLYAARERWLRGRDSAGPVRAYGGLTRPELPVFAPPRDSAWTNAWRVTEALLSAIVDSAARHRVPVVLALVAAPIAVSPKREMRAAMAASAGTADLFYPDRRLSAYGRRRGVPVIALGPPMAAFAESTGTSLHGFGNLPDFGHWNAAGHRVAAGILGSFLCRSGALDVVASPGE